MSIFQPRISVLLIQKFIAKLVLALALRWLEKNPDKPDAELCEAKATYYCPTKCLMWKLRAKISSTIRVKSQLLWSRMKFLSGELIQNYLHRFYINLLVAILPVCLLCYKISSLLTKGIDLMQLQQDFLVIRTRNSFEIISVVKDTKSVSSRKTTLAENFWCNHLEALYIICECSAITASRKLVISTRLYYGYKLGKTHQNLVQFITSKNRFSR